MPKKRTPEEQREYMRDYRARKKGVTEAQAPKNIAMVRDVVADRDRKIAELEEEIRRLKQELAGRPGGYAKAPLTTNAIAGPQTATPRGVTSKRKADTRGMSFEEILARREAGEL